VQLAPGDHEVRFSFRSRPARLGLGITLLSALALSLALLKARRPQTLD